MHDLISRQDAITEFSCCELTPDGGIDANYAIDFLKHMPSARPDSKELSFTHKALDTISRQAAIDLFPNDTLEWDTKCGYIAPHLARQMIEELPSVQPDLSEYSDKLWRSAYERGKRDAQPEIIYCKDCKWFGRIGCAVSIVDDSDKPTENDFCSFAERREE